jgi:hypothetical protein
MATPLAAASAIYRFSALTTRELFSTANAPPVQKSF